MFRRLHGYQLAVDLTLAGLFFLALGFIPLMPGADQPPWVLTPLLSLSMAAALALRRLSPTLALAVAWAGSLLQIALGMPPLPSNMAIFCVLYAVAAYGNRLLYWLGFLSAFLGACVIAVYLVFHFALPMSLTQRLLIGALYLSTALFALLLSWTVGALVRAMMRSRTNRIAQERAEALAAAEQERVRIARDMHDVVAHSLAVVIAQADGARYAAAAHSQQGGAATEALTTIAQTARSALADVRLLLTQLRHRQIDGPQPTLADLEGLYAQVRATGRELRVDVDPVPRGEIPAAVQLAVYRILQEALTNALRHGDGGVVGVWLAWRADRVELVVRNGMPAPRAAPVAGAAGVGEGAPAADAAGHGIIGMRERAQLAGGTLIAGAEGSSFLVRAALPVRGEG